MFETLEPDLRATLEEAVDYHPEFLVFLANPNASIEALESLAARNKRNLQNRR